MPNKPIQEIEGIGREYIEILQSVGITSTDDLLAAGGTRRGRRDLVKQTKIGESLIIKWVHLCNLFRLDAFASQDAGLLQAAGISTLQELRRSNATILEKILMQANERLKMTREAPSIQELNDWIEQAKKLPPAIVNY